MHYLLSAFFDTVLWEMVASEAKRTQQELCLEMCKALVAAQDESEVQRALEKAKELERAVYMLRRTLGINSLAKGRERQLEVEAGDAALRAACRRRLAQKKKEKVRAQRRRALRAAQRTSLELRDGTRCPLQGFARRRRRQYAERRAAKERRKLKDQEKEWELKLADERWVKKEPKPRAERESDDKASPSPAPTVSALPTSLFFFPFSHPLFFGGWDFRPFCWA